MEITAPLELSIDEENLIDMHSVLNVLNVITYELMRMETILGDVPELETLIKGNENAAKILRDREQAHELVRKIGDFIAQTEDVLQTLATKENKAEDAEFKESFENIRSIFNILEIRAAEIAARIENPTAWVRHDISKLKDNFINLFRAIEQNSHGGYHIVHNIAEHESGRYFVSFEINSISNDFLYMPAVFQDVVRDLIANGRKYTPPGGRIISGLSQNEERLRLVVTDTGMGIPKQEIASVVQFGKRASNAKDRPTRGGGFGLTKAYYVTRKFGGRMWIESTGVPGEGTNIEITIPLPPEIKSRLS